MNELMQNLKRHVERAKDNYISSFSFFKILSKRRATDLQRLLNIVSNPSANIFSAIYEIKRTLKQMKTGWWIFNFGHSKLKNLVEEEIKKFKKIYNVKKNVYLALAPKVEPNSIQQVVQIPAVPKTKIEKFTISEFKNHLQFKPKARVQNSKQMLKLDTENSLQNIDFLM